MIVLIVHGIGDHHCEKIMEARNAALRRTFRPDPSRLTKDGGSAKEGMIFLWWERKGVCVPSSLIPDEIEPGRRWRVSG
jgi:hypothetical protein